MLAENSILLDLPYTACPSPYFLLCHFWQDKSDTNV